jgi:hypothetical protein
VTREPIHIQQHHCPPTSFSLTGLRSRETRAKPKLELGTVYALHGESGVSDSGLVIGCDRSGDIHKDFDPIDVVPASIGVANVATSPKSQHSAKRLVDTLIIASCQTTYAGLGLANLPNSLGSHQIATRSLVSFAVRHNCYLSAELPLPNAHRIIDGNSRRHISSSCPAALSFITTSALASRNAAAHRAALSRKKGSSVPATRYARGKRLGIASGGRYPPPGEAQKIAP